MNRKTSILALFMAMTIATSMLTACGGKKEPSSSDSSDVASSIESGYHNDESQVGGDGDESSTPDQNPDSSEPGNADGSKPGSASTTTTRRPAHGRKLIGNTFTTGFPIVKNKEKLKIMTIGSPSYGDLQKNAFTKDFEQMTNVQIEWVLVPEEKINERKVLALQSGNLPDMFSLYTTSITDAEVANYSKNGAFVDLTAAIEAYGENIKRVFEKIPAAKAVSTSLENKKIYTLPYITETKVAHTLAINQVWLNKLGLPIPKTMDEFYDTLVAFKNEDPNGNGQNDEIPFATFMINNGLFIPWGISDFLAIGKDGKLVYTPTTENQRRALIFWNKVYKEDLMDKSSLGDMAGDWQKYRQLISGGKVGIWQWQNVNDFSEVLLKQYVPISWPSAGLNLNNLPSNTVKVGATVGGRGFIITKACKNVPMAVRVADFFYSDDGYMYKMYGAPGKYYTKIGDNYQMKSFKEGDEKKDAPGTLLNGINYLMDGKKLDAPGKTSVEKARAGFMTKANNEYLRRVKETGSKQVFRIFSPTEADRLNRYTVVDGNTVHWNYLMRFIKDEFNIQTQWSTFVQNVESKGLAEYMKIQQTAFDRGKPYIK